MIDGKKITVWFISGWYPTRVHSTRGNFIEKHAEAASRYCNVAVLHVCTDPLLQSKQEIILKEDKGFPELIIYLSPTSKIPFISSVRQYLRFRKAYREGSRMLAEKTGSPDILHSNIIYPVTAFTRLLARTYNIPYLVSEHWTGYTPDDPAKPSAFALRLSKKYVRHASAVLPASSHLGRCMEQMGLKAHYITMTNVVDTLLFRPIAKGAHSGPYSLLHISTLDPLQKNFDGLLRAVALLKKRSLHFNLEIISDGDFSIYQNTIADLGLTDVIMFHGKCNTADVAAITAQCDVLLLFSRYENFPCVIPEALSAGIPVLSTRVGGIEEHLDENLGKLVESEDETAFANALEQMLNNLTYYNSEKLHSYAEQHFSYDAIGRNLQSIYQQYTKK